MGEEEEGWGGGSAPDPIPSLPGYGSAVTMVQKGCWTGPAMVQMQRNDKALPPHYSVVRGCGTDFCNTNLQTHDSLPNLSRGMRGAGLGVGRDCTGLGGAPARARARPGEGVVSAGLLLPVRWDSSAQVGPDGSPGAMHIPHDRTEDHYLNVRPRSLASAQPADAQRRQVLLLRGDPPGGLHPGEVPAGPVSPGPKHLLPGQWQHDLW